MISIRESIDVEADVEALYEWFLHLDENFTKWNPKHLSFELLTGGLGIGDQISFREDVQGVSYDVRGTIMQHEKDEDGFRVMFVTKAGLGHIWFIGERTGTGCRFTHVEEFGKPDTMMGRIVNWLLFKVIAKKRADWDLIQEDMMEDNLYLKEMLEQHNTGHL